MFSALQYGIINGTQTNNTWYSMQVSPSTVAMTYSQTSPTILHNAISVNSTGTNVQGNLLTSGSISCSSISCSGKVSGYTTFCSGKVNTDGTKAFTSASSEVDFTVTNPSTGTYLITYSYAHPAGSNYVIQLTSYYSLVSVRSVVAPSSTGFGVVTWAASTPFPTGQNNAFYFTVAYYMN